MTKHSPFRYFKTSPEIIRLAVMLYVRFPLSLRNVEDLLHERGIEISHETVRFWWNRFGPMFAAEIRRNRVSRMRSYSNWQWHLDEVFAIDKWRDTLSLASRRSRRMRHWKALCYQAPSYRKAALKFRRKVMQRYGGPEVVGDGQTTFLRRCNESCWQRGSAGRRAAGVTIGRRILT